MKLDPDLVVLIHDFILQNEPGLAGINRGALEGALGRIESRRYYQELDDIFEIAGM
ncbi:Death ON curing protein (fragment) [Paraburkholderia piptadeniae]|uniref:Death ON curing protein n=1 Tax=Paraburkholderia piptadeniae TaxID=1701573 RepID=A0A1N7RTQ6_9BURK